MSRAVKVVPAGEPRKKAAAVSAASIVHAINDQIDRIYQTKSLCEVAARALSVRMISRLAKPWHSLPRSWTISRRTSQRSGKSCRR